MGNAMTTAAGFLLASRGQIDYLLLFSTLLGLSLVVASAGVFNNYLDRDSDAKMSRTKNRPLAKKLISNERALIFAAVLGMLGFVLLAWLTNRLTVAITAGGFVTYVWLYGIWKYRSIHGTLIGSISGAVPPLVGYCAASNQLDAGAWILFAILVLWQMPHFFAIALYRLHDYAAASIPVLPVKKGAEETKVQMLVYIVAFLAASISLTLFDYTGYAYLVTALLLGSIWFGMGLSGFKTQNNQKWAYSMFVFSLITIMTLCVMMTIDFVPNPLI